MATLTRVVRHVVAYIHWLRVRHDLKPVLLFYESDDHAAEYKLLVGSYESVAHAERARAFDMVKHDGRVANLYTIQSPRSEPQ